MQAITILHLSSQNYLFPYQLELQQLAQFPEDKWVCKWSQYNMDMEYWIQVRLVLAIGLRKNFHATLLNVLNRAQPPDGHVDWNRRRPAQRFRRLYLLTEHGTENEPDRHAGLFILRQFHDWRDTLTNCLSLVQICMKYTDRWIPLAPVVVASSCWMKNCIKFICCHFSNDPSLLDECGLDSASSISSIIFSSSLHSPFFLYFFSFDTAKKKKMCVSPRPYAQKLATFIGESVKNIPKEQLKSPTYYM